MKSGPGRPWPWRRSRSSLRNAQFGVGPQAFVKIPLGPFGVSGDNSLLDLTGSSRLWRPFDQVQALKITRRFPQPIFPLAAVFVGWGRDSDGVG